LQQLDIVAEFEIDKEALEKTAQSNVEYECSTSGGASKRGALGPFGLYVLADGGLSEYTPVYFYVVKGSDGKFTTSFCSDQSRYLTIGSGLCAVTNCVQLRSQGRMIVRL